VILAHNHPSGDATPSEDDRRITEEIAAAGRILKIQVLDHIIVVGAGQFTSLSEKGEMPRLAELGD
jgi:DNA repair protein RadC